MPPARIIPRSPAFAALWKRGTTKKVIAHAIGCSEGSITYAAKQMGLPPRKPGPRAAQ